jgi:hypothetical protein
MCHRRPDRRGLTSGALGQGKIDQRGYGAGEVARGQVKSDGLLEGGNRPGGVAAQVGILASAVGARGFAQQGRRRVVGAGTPGGNRHRDDHP